ncbi:MAG: DNA recombination protein RmuC [Candidatus Magasanikbacteria bacterium]|jgi:DNA recombination protein RmuC|nr:DNA recombination protein RmuC [Candidatus Magasanikbacteria bacterium]
MQVFIVTLLTLLLILAAGAIFFLYKKLDRAESTTEDASEKQSFLLLQNQLQDLIKTVDQKMSDTNKQVSNTERHLHQTLQEQFTQNTRLISGITSESSKIIAQITEKLTTLDKTNQQVIGFSEQLGNLEKVLTSQKQRGNLGEAGLQLVLENMLPPTAFSFQYQFEDGDTVDAAIFTKDGIIPVDAKFSLENYTKILQEKDENRKEQLEKDFKNDLKKRIDETAKYIKPKYGTMDFAFMFIPAEAIYYDLLVNEVGAVKVNTRNLIEYAFKEKKVIIVSPTTFAAYLQTVLQGLRALQIEEGAKDIRKNVEMLGKHINAYDSFMKKLGGSLGTTVNHYNTAYKELAKIDKDITRITAGERFIDPLQLDTPQQDDAA